MSKLWGGRFEAPADELVEALGESVSFDARLAPWDIQGSVAHARMLGQQGIISQADADAIIAGLETLASEIAQGQFHWDPALEDVHTNIEAALTERIGDAGKRLHTGRSRNDQIALDTRMWARDQAAAVREGLTALMRALIDFGEAHVETLLPGCTHLQHAQPVLLGHHALAYVEMLRRDRERFAELHNRINVLPLGSAALAGTPYPIDRECVARELGFDSVSRNSMDAVSDRDFAVEFCADAAIVMMHLSRLCEELILWSTPEYGFITIGDAFTTGSSIMPQKKNPDVAELVRGKTARVYGDVTAILTLMKGLPLTYNRDMQEDKLPLFDASDTVQLCLAAMARMIPAVEVHAGRMEAAAREGFLEATDLADYLVEKGVPFREAHHTIGRIVAHCVKHGLRLGDLPEEELRAYSGEFGADALDLLDPRAIVERRGHVGGTAALRVREALQEARAAL